MSKIIIGVHGLGNKPPAKILKKWWKKSMQEGLQAIGHPRWFFKFALVYWAHFVHDFPLDPGISDRKHPAYLKEPYVPCQQIETREPSKFRQVVLDYLEKQMDKIFLKEDLSINFSSVSDLIIHRFFSDLDLYYSQTHLTVHGREVLVKDIIREQLARVIKRHKNKQIMLIGHSMGSIIAYDVLTYSVPDIEIDTFVTIGSPLGLPVIMSKIASEQKQELVKKTTLSTPENVVNKWFNLSDLNDRVAMNYTLGDDFDENSHHVRAIDKIVYNNYEYNGRRNPHKVYGYLRTPELAEIIHNFLNQGRSNAMIWLSDKFNNWLTANPFARHCPIQEVKQ